MSQGHRLHLNRVVFTENSHLWLCWTFSPLPLLPFRHFVCLYKEANTHRFHELLPPTAHTQSLRDLRYFPLIPPWLYLGLGITRDTWKVAEI